MNININLTINISLKFNNDKWFFACSLSIYISIGYAMDSNWKFN